jgi:hypothetical protein
MFGEHKNLLAAILIALGFACLDGITVSAQFGGTQSSQADIAKAKAAATPRFNNGHPDLAGYWGGPEARGEVKVSADGKTIELQIATPKGILKQQGESGNAEGRGRRPGSEPEYRPELLAKVKALHDNATDEDPTYRCMPEGLPRIGPPTEIFQTADAVALIYANHNLARIIPTDGRAHDKTADPSYFGDAVGRWEGETLVVDVNRFNDLTWLNAEQGYFHTEALHVIERFTREGNTLRYEVTVEDPNVLAKRWVLNPRILMLGKPGQHLIEDPPCKEMDQTHLVDKYHKAP